MDIHQKFRATSFAIIEWRLARGDFIPPADLALAIEANPDVAPPPAIRDYLIRTLRGEVKAPRGRKPGGAVSQLLALYAVVLYERYLRWLQARERQLGLSDSPGDHWWQGPPHERAARMVVQRLRLHCDWRNIQNVRSRQR